MASTTPANADDAVAALVRDAVADLVALYRFGSTAKGTAGDASDVDLALLAGRPLTPERRLELSDRLATLLRRPVDVVDLGVASTVLAVQVIATGRVLVEPDPQARGAFEDQTLSAYVRLNEERRGILERVAAEGTVYGR